MQTIDVIKGTATDVPFQLRDGNGNALTTILDSDTLSSKVWAGDDQVNLATPAVVWDDKTTAKATLKITSDDITDLPSALYQVIVLFTRGSVTKPAFRAWLSVKPSPGTASPLRVYGRYSDLQTIMPTLESYQLEQSETAYVEEREMSSRWLDSIIVGKFRCPEYVQGLLDADKLVVTPEVSVLVANYALFLALRPKVGMKGISDGVSGLAKAFKTTAEDMAKTITVKIEGLYPISLSSVTVRRA